MQVSQPSLFMRPDTLLGVCQALGEDFGFNPLYLRVTLSVLIIFSPVAVIGTYLGAGVVVMLSRLIFPKPRAVMAVEAQPIAEPAQPKAVHHTRPELLDMAA